MPAPRTVVNCENFKEIYRYLSRALDEGRLFDNDFPQKKEALKVFTQLKLPPDTETASKRECFFTELQFWMDSYVREDMRKKCLSALRWNRAKEKNQTKNIKLNHNVYVLLRQYARKRQLTIQQAIYEAILPHVYINPNADDNLTLHNTIPLDPEKAKEKAIKGSTSQIQSNKSDKPGFKITIF